MGFLKKLFSGPAVQLDYSGHTDEDLRALWAQRDQLTDQAQKLLLQEMERRGLSVKPARPEEGDAPDELPKSIELPMEDPRVAEAMRLQQLASQAYAQGDLNGMLAAAERSLELFRESLGEDHVALGTALNLLAVAKKEMGDTDEAAQLMERAVSTVERAIGPDDPMLLPHLRNLGNFHRLRGRLDESERVLRRALELGEKSLSPDEPGLAYAMEDLIETLRALGRDDEADELKERVDQIYDAIAAEAP